MRALFNGSVDPYFNLAAEEYLLMNADCDVFMLWRNSPSVIVGKNQNAWAEVNVDYVKDNGIPVVRRLTGGGAVFHDLENVNFSFVTKADEGTQLNFEKFTRPIIDALRSFGVEASLDGRNDLVAEGAKISGNAECVVTNARGEKTMLHHGTLLFNADIAKLAAALRADPEKMKSRGIKSVSARVKNIRSLDSYRGPDGVEDFMAKLFSAVSDGEAGRFTDAEKACVKELKRTKYSLWEWNYGSSPEFEITNSARFPFGTVGVSLTCRHGTIEKIKINGDFFGTEDVSLLEDAIVGAKYEAASVSEILEERRALLSECISGASPEQISPLICK